MEKPKTGAQVERDRIAKTERVRAQRIRLWSQARNEGIREGLLMAITAIEPVVTHRPGQTPIEIEAIRARGNQHFGDEEWQTKPRPG